MTTTQTLGERIRGAREEAGLTQSQVARAIGVLEPAVSRWENGHNVPRLRQRLALAELLRRPVEDFEEPAASSDDTAVQALARVLLDHLEDALHGSKRENTTRWADRRQQQQPVQHERRQRVTA